MWHFIKSVCVERDESNYKWETSSNGGNYSFYTYNDWYVSQFPNGEWKFAYIQRRSTSADFSYDEINGTFQQNLNCFVLTNTVGFKTYQVSMSEDEEEVLEKVAVMGSFKDLWDELFEYIPSRYNRDCGGYYSGRALSFSDKKEIVRILRVLGCVRDKQIGGNRGRQYRSWNGRRR